MEKLVKKRRDMLGNPSEMIAHLASILEQPNSLRERARRAIFQGKPDPIKKESLCSDLSSNFYKDELYELAKELDLPATKSTTKRELCDLLSNIIREAESITYSEQEEKETVAEKKLKKALDFTTVDFRTVFRPEYNDEVYSCNHCNTEGGSETLKHYNSCPKYCFQIYNMKTKEHSKQPTA